MWNTSPQQDSLSLLTPFGQTLAQWTLSPTHQLQLHTPTQHLTTAETQQRMQRYLPPGWPIQKLHDVLLGAIDTQHGQYHCGVAQHGQIAGWQLSWQDYRCRHGYRLPTKITFAHANDRLIFMLAQHTLPPGEDPLCPIL